MNLTALVEGPDHVCCRYRLAAFRPHLERAGHTLELREFPAHWWDWWLLRKQLKAVDLVILQRKLPASWQLSRLRRASRCLVFDFDDAVFLRDSYAAKTSPSSTRQRRFTEVLRACAGVVAGNAFLAEQAARWVPAERVTGIPTCIDVDKYTLAEHTRVTKGVELVWVGSSSTLQGMELAQPLLELVGQRVPGLQLKLLSDRFFTPLYLPVIAVKWSEASEAAALAASDIGISWLPDDLWSRGKCGLKVLQYMAAGLPVVANPVGVHAEMIVHEETGFLLRTPDQWTEAIGRLARDPALRRRMGRAGRRRLEKEFSVTAGALRWLKLLEKLEASRPKEPAPVSPGIQPPMAEKR